MRSQLGSLCKFVIREQCFYTFCQPKKWVILPSLAVETIKSGKIHNDVSRFSPFLLFAQPVHGTQHRTIIYKHKKVDKNMSFMQLKISDTIQKAGVLFLWRFIALNAIVI